MHFRHVDVDHSGRRQFVVCFVLRFVHFIIDVGTNDDAVLPAFDRGDKRRQARRIGLPHRQRTGVRHLAQQAIAHIPGIIARQIHRVRPGAIDRRRLVVSHHPRQRRQCADVGRPRCLHRFHEQIRRRRQLDQQLLWARSRVVLLFIEFEHLAARLIGTRRIGDHEHVIRTDQIRRQTNLRADRVTAPRRQARRMFEPSDISIGVQIEHAIERQIHQILPLALIGRCRAGSVIRDRVRKIDVLTDQPVLGNRDVRHLQVRRRR